MLAAATLSVVMGAGCMPVAFMVTRLADMAGADAVAIGGAGAITATVMAPDIMAMPLSVLRLD